MKKSILSSTTFLLCVLAAWLGWQVYEKDAEISRLKMRAEQTANAIAEKKGSVDRQAFEIQAKCAAQSDKLAKQMGFDGSGHLEDVRNHFNAKLNKCFLSVTGYTDGFVQSDLLDAFERTDYAQYTKMNRLGKETIEHCFLTPPGVPAVPCSTKREYDAFVASYMQ